MINHMNPKQILIFLAILLYKEVYAADSYIKLDSTRTIMECIYRYSEHQGNDKLSSEYYTILSIGEQLAKFEDYSLYQRDSVANIPNVDGSVLAQYDKQVERNANFFEPIVFQDIAQKALTVYDVIVPDYYVYEEEIPKVWELIDSDTLTVAGYLCNKAFLHYGGKDWIVWYTFDLPLSNGPWKLSGLPGLILKAETADQHLKFEAIILRPSKSYIGAAPKRPYLKTHRKLFVKRKNEVYENPMKNIPNESVTEMTVIKVDEKSKIAYINGVRLRMGRKYVPIEE